MDLTPFVLLAPVVSAAAGIVLTTLALLNEVRRWRLERERRRAARPRQAEASRTEPSV